MEIVAAGFDVIGIDLDRNKINTLKQGKSYILDVPEETLEAAIQSGKFTPTCDFSTLATADTVSICVPTPLSKSRDPDISFILSATEEIRKYLHAGQLVVLESTTYPGTTDELIVPELESSGLKVGKDFFVAFSPERIDPGNLSFNTHNTPKIVGGITAQCTEIARLFYSQFIERVIPVSSSKCAEMVKLLENTFRSVNIGMVNELAQMCDLLGVDVYEVIDAAATKPFGFSAFYPGPGLGGHCIPIDPFRKRGTAARARSGSIGILRMTPRPCFPSTVHAGFNARSVTSAVWMPMSCDESTRLNGRRPGENGEMRQHMLAQGAFADGRVESARKSSHGSRRQTGTEPRRGPACAARWRESCGLGAVARYRDDAAL